MKILIDINHPAHVHYFRKLYEILLKRGHEILFVTRDRYPCIDLLEHYGIKYINRGKGKDSIIGKLLGIIKFDVFYIKTLLQFKADMVVSFATPYPHHIAKLFKIHSIALVDTEHADKIHRKITYPFCDYIITPDNYENDFGDKHIRVFSTIENFYINKNNIIDNVYLKKKLNIVDNDIVFFLRFTAGTAHHDSDFKSISHSFKKELIKKMTKIGRVFVSLENKDSLDFEEYALNIEPYEMHQFISCCNLFITDSGTMASEAAMLGIPVIYTNNLPLMCYLKRERERGLLFHKIYEDDISEKLDELLPEILNRNNRYKKLSQDMLNSFIDINKFLIWFLENYPNSVNIIKEEPDYQYKFK